MVVEAAEVAGGIENDPDGTLQDDRVEEKAGLSTIRWPYVGNCRAAAWKPSRQLSHGLMVPLLMRGTQKSELPDELDLCKFEHHHYSPVSDTSDVISPQKGVCDCFTCLIDARCERVCLPPATSGDGRSKALHLRFSQDLFSSTARRLPLVMSSNRRCNIAGGSHRRKANLRGHSRQKQIWVDR